MRPLPCMNHHDEPLPAYQIPVPSTPLLGSALSCAPYHSFALLPLLCSPDLDVPLPCFTIRCFAAKAGGGGGSRTRYNVSGVASQTHCKRLSPPMCLSCPVLCDAVPASARQTYPAIPVLCRARDDVPCHCVAAAPCRYTSAQSFTVPTTAVHC